MKFLFLIFLVSCGAQEEIEQPTVGVLVSVDPSDPAAEPEVIEITTPDVLPEVVSETSEPSEPIGPIESTQPTQPNNAEENVDETLAELIDLVQSDELPTQDESPDTTSEPLPSCWEYEKVVGSSFQKYTRTVVECPDPAPTPTAPTPAADPEADLDPQPQPNIADLFLN